MPVLDWIGKDKVVNHHLDVPFHVLERQYSFDKDGKHAEDNGSENMIIHGDNLTALKSLLPKYEGKINCIYIDPPYNTGKEDWIYNDNVNDPQIKKWLGSVVGTEGEDLSRHDKWLCMMYPRLRLLQKLLSDDGAIFISIDDNEQANLKLICDEIFGRNNAIGPIIQNKMNAKNDTVNVQKNHEFILVYRKTPQYLNKTKIKPTLTVREIKRKKVFEEAGRYYFVKDAITTRGEGGTLNARPNLGYTVYYNPTSGDKIGVVDYDVNMARTSNNYQEIYRDRADLINNGYIAIRPPKVRGQLGCWTWEVEKFNNDKDNIIVVQNRKNGYAVKKRVFVPYEAVKFMADNTMEYADVTESNSRSIVDFSTTQGTESLNAIMERQAIFDNPKNSEMLSYLFSMISNPNAIILDSFAGSGTTAHAVLNLNTQDGGSRKFILVELMDYADSITAERVKRVINGYGEGNSAVEGTGGDFSFYELGEPLMKDGVLNESVGADKIREYVYYTETKQKLENKADEPFYLGTAFDTAYYFYYEPDDVTTLDTAFLQSIKTEAEHFVIYADRCILSSAELEKYGVTFKKIPRDVAVI